MTDTQVCTCFPVENPWTYYGIVEPGGAMEWNPECPEHRPAQLDQDRAAIQSLTDPGVPWPAAAAAVRAIPEQRLHNAIGLGPADADVGARYRWLFDRGRWTPLGLGAADVDDEHPTRHPIVRVRMVASVVDGYPPTVIHQWRAQCIRGGLIGTLGHELPGYSHTWSWHGAPLTLDGTAWQQGMDDLGQQIAQHLWEAHSVG